MDQQPKHQSDYEQQNDLIILALKISYQNERILNCAVYNQNKRTFYVAEFTDNQFFSSLEALLIQLNPKDNDSEFRVIYVPPDLDTQMTKLLGLFSGVQNSEFSEASLKKKHNLEKTLEFLLENEISHYYMHTNNSKSMSVLGSLIDELKLESDETNKKKMKLDTINLQKYMKLDQAAILGLQIFPKNQQKRVISSNDTLFEVLCKCKTTIGARTLKRWMKQPLQDEGEINRRLDCVQYFMKNSEMRNYIQNQVLNSVCDLEKLYFTFYKVASQKPCKTEMSDLVKILKLVKSLERFLEKVRRKEMSEFERKNLYDVLAKNVEILGNPVTMIEKNIVMDGKESEFYIKPSTQKSLHNIMEEKNEVLSQIDQEERRVKKELKADVQLIKIGNQNQTYVFQGPKQKVQEALKSRGGREYKAGTIRGKRMTFKSNNLTRLSQELKEVESRYDVEQKVILNKMIKAIATYYEILEEVSEIISSLDIFTSWALFLSCQSLSVWTRPTFGQELILRQVRHPCVKDCIPSDLELVQNQKSAIITGPNMGGKSTFIRMVGISVYLSHIGFFVPASFYESPIIDAIITRVGASDAQLQGVSTFMNEMLESSCAISSASKKSLVLIDELGRGTSTHQGFGMAWGILQYLHLQKHSYCLFATHFKELTLMADEIGGVINLHAQCHITNDDIIMDYKVVPGKSNKSYGIQLIKSMKFKESVIDAAEEFYHGLEIYDHHPSPAKKGKENVRMEENGNSTLSYEYKQSVLQTVEDMKRNQRPDSEIQEYLLKVIQT